MIATPAQRKQKSVLEPESRPLLGSSAPTSRSIARTAAIRFGIVDTPDLYYADLVADPNHRYNDRDLLRAFVDMSAPTFEWLIACGVVYPETLPEAVETKIRSVAALWTAPAHST